MANFSGQLRSNEVFAALYNMIIGQVVFSDNLQKHQTLVEQAKEEAGLYGDQKLFYSADIIPTHAWGVDATHPKGGVMDAEASNLLSLDRPEAPECQALVIDTFRQVRLSTDDYISKRAWASESAFADFTSVMIGMINNAKKVYEGTLYNVFIGTTVASGTAQNVSVDLGTGSGHPLYNLTGVEKEQMEAMLIAQRLADLFVEMGDYSRDFNDYGHMRSYADENIKVIWNAKYVNKIRKVDTPTIFHREGLVDKLDEDILPARYFGTVITATNKSDYAAASPTAGKPIDSDDNTYVPGVGHANGCIRSCVEKDVKVSNVDYHLFPGDEIPAGSTIVASGTFEPGEVYIEQADVICKVVVKLPPMLSAFSVGTSFFNPRALITNRYLTWGHSTLEYLKNYPFITVKKA